jgi:hypothetical protein
LLDNRFLAHKSCEGLKNCLQKGIAIELVPADNCNKNVDFQELSSSVALSLASADTSSNAGGGGGAGGGGVPVYATPARRPSGLAAVRSAAAAAGSQVHTHPNDDHAHGDSSGSSVRGSGGEGGGLATAGGGGDGVGMGAGISSPFAVNTPTGSANGDGASSEGQQQAQQQGTISPLTSAYLYPGESWDGFEKGTSNKMKAAYSGANPLLQKKNRNNGTPAVEKALPVVATPAATNTTVTAVNATAENRSRPDLQTPVVARTLNANAAHSSHSHSPSHSHSKSNNKVAPNNDRAMGELLSQLSSPQLKQRAAVLTETYTVHDLPTSWASVRLDLRQAQGRTWAQFVGEINPFPFGPQSRGPPGSEGDSKEMGPHEFAMRVSSGQESQVQVVHSGGVIFLLVVSGCFAGYFYLVDQQARR